MNELNDDWLSWPPEAMDRFFNDVEPIDIDEEQHLPKINIQEPNDARISTPIF